MIISAEEAHEILGEAAEDMNDEEYANGSLP